MIVIAEFKMCQSKRRWNEIQHQDFRQLATYISFRAEEVDNFNWSHRRLVQKLVRIISMEDIGSDDYVAEKHLIISPIFFNERDLSKLSTYLPYSTIQQLVGEILSSCIGK